MYFLTADIKTSLGICQHFLATDGHWYQATNNIKSFPSPMSASNWLRTKEADIAWDNLPVATYIHINGPKGGRYYMSNGKQMR